MLIEGIFAAIPTPFYPDERVYYRKIEANIARYSRTQLSGLVILGSTGEAPMLSDQETGEVLRCAAGATAPEKVLIAGVSRDSVCATLELAETAAAAGYDAILVHPPSYFGSLAKSEAQLLYFRMIADRSPLPVLLYNAPGSPEIPVEIVAALSQHRRIIGIKDSTSELGRIRQTIVATRSAPERTTVVTPVFQAVTGRMLAAADAGQSESAHGFVPATQLAGSTTAAPPMPSPAKTRTRQVGFQVLAGNASLVLPAIEQGASGAILAFAAFAPEACQEIYYAWKDHDPKLATMKQERIAAVNQRIVRELGVSGIKYACDFNGFFGGHPRSPQVQPSAADQAEIEGLLAGIRS